MAHKASKQADSSEWNCGCREETKVHLAVRTRDFFTRLGQRYIIMLLVGLESASQSWRRAGGVGRRSLIIRLGCPPRWAARSASFRGDGWILWEITRPSARIGISHTTIIVYYATQAACTYIPNTRH